MNYRLTSKKIFTKDGHKMFYTDVLKDLHRKEFLERDKIKQQAMIEELKYNLNNANESAIYHENCSVGFFNKITKLEEKIEKITDSMDIRLSEVFKGKS